MPRVDHPRRRGRGVTAAASRLSRFRPRSPSASPGESSNSLSLWEWAGEREWLAPFLVLVVGLLVRLYRIDLAPFDVDQANLLLAAERMLQTGQVPAVGGATFSVGINIPPLITFLLAVPLALTHSAAWLAACQATVDAFAAVFVYATVRRISSAAGALTAGLFYAVLPAAVVNARLITNGGPTPFLCAVALWALVGFLQTGNGLEFALAVLAMALAVQLHLTLSVFGLALLAAAAFRWRDIRWRPLALAVAAAGVPLLPYGYLQLRTGFSDVKAMAGFLGAPKITSSAAFEVSSSIVGGDIHSRYASTPLDPLGWLLVAAAIFGGVLACRKRQAATVLPVVWLLLPVLSTIRHAETIAPHYFFGFLPAAAVLVGLAMAGIPKQVGLALVAAFVLLRVGQWAGFQADLAAGSIPQDYPVARPASASYDPTLRYSQPYNVPLRFSEQAVALARGASQAGRPVFVGPRQDYDRVFRFLDDGSPPVVGLAAQHTTLLPEPGAILLLDRDGQSMVLPLQRYASPVASVAPSPARTIYRLFRLDDGWLDRFNAALRLQPLEATFAGQLQLSGFSLAPMQAGRASQLTLEWRPHDLPAGELGRLHLFAHLVDTAGKLWSSNPDLAVFEATQWQTGSAILSQTALTPLPDTPTGGYWLELGLYGHDPAVRLPVGVPGAGVVSQLRPGPLKVLGAGPREVPGPIRASFGAGEIGLSEVTFTGAEVRLTWAALAKPKADYTAFVHVLDASGQLIAQHDGPPGTVSYPTSLWDPGEVVHDRHRLSGSLAGAATLEIGLYTQPRVRRLDVADASGVGLGTAYHVPL